MTVRLVSCLVLLSALLIARPVVAQSPYFNEYVDYQKFVSLDPSDKRQFILSFMQTLSDMEQEMIENGAMNDASLEKTVRQQRWEDVQKILKRLNELAVPSAYAAGTQNWGRCHNRAGNDVRPSRAAETCIYGSYESTFVQVNGSGRRICQRPACSVDENIRRRHDQLASASGCTGTQMACNPMLFGYEEYPASGTPTRASCVPMDSGNRSVDHNATLACMMMVVRDPARRDNRLDRIAESIARNPTIAVEFGRLLHAITNLCICDGQMNQRAPNWVTRMSAAYSSYMKDHRTCNALLSQTSLVLEKLNPQGACVRAVLPPGIQNFANDLSFIRNYSSNFYNLMGESGDAVVSQENLNRALIQYSNRWVVDRASPGNASGTPCPPGNTNSTCVLSTDANKALDNISTYQTALAGLKARPAGATSWCPLPIPELPSTLTCTISAATSTRAADGKVSVAATVAVNGLAEGVTASNIVWKANGAVVAGQSGLRLAAENLDGIAADATAVPVEASYTPAGGTAITCQGSAAFPADNVACTISETIVNDGTNANITLTVTKNEALWPADRAMTVTQGDTAITPGEEGALSITVPRSQGTVVVTATAAAAEGAEALSCTKTIQLEGEAAACALTIGDLTPHTGGKFKATVTATFTSITPDAIAWTPNNVASGTAGAADSSRVVEFDAPTGTPSEVVASIVATAGTQTVECTQTKAAAASGTELCRMSVAQTTRSDGKIQLSATLLGTTSTTEPEGEPTYTGFSFTTANKVGTAIVDAPRTTTTTEASASYTGKDGKNYRCTFSTVIVGVAAPAAPASSGPFQQPQQMVIPKAGQSLFKPGLR